VRRESRRLSRAFGALLLALTPAAAAQACSDSSGSGTGTDAAADDRPASDLPDTALADAAADSDGNLRVIDPCSLVAETIDAGPDALPDADLGCRYTLPCGIPDSGGFVLRGCDFFLYTADPDASDGSLGCTIPEVYGCSNGVYTPPASGTLTFECLDCFGGGGRRPVGLRRPRPIARVRARDAVGDYFARMAHDEAASVHAFVRMHAELSRLGAPTELVSAAERSADDERRHARMMAKRARASGAPPSAARMARTRPRRLEAIARENAVEGCVQETFGALLLRWQAAHAANPSLRSLFARVAADETRHAALSWEVARWAEERLDAPARARVLAARSRAVRALRNKLAARRDGAARSVVGHPLRAEALALLDGMVATLALGA
jgi:rubrerythrin